MTWEMSDFDFKQQRAKVLDASLAQIVREQAESRWKRDSHAERIAEIEADIRRCRQEIAWLAGLDFAALQKAYEGWLEHATKQVKRRNELAVAPYAYLTELLTAAMAMRDALETDSPLREALQPPLIQPSLNPTITAVTDIMGGGELVSNT